MCLFLYQCVSIVFAALAQAPAISRRRARSTARRVAGMLWSIIARESFRDSDRRRVEWKAKTAMLFLAHNLFITLSIALLLRAFSQDSSKLAD